MKNNEGTYETKHLGKWTLTLIRYGAPHHGPRVRKAILSRSEHGWRLHLTLKTSQAWDGWRNADFSFALRPSRERLESEATR
jgi:hypothetical protein